MVTGSLFPLQYLAKNYETDEYVRWLLDNTRLHIMPSMNPDGFEVANEGTCQGGQGRSVRKYSSISRGYFLDGDDHYA